MRPPSVWRADVPVDDLVVVAADPTEGPWIVDAGELDATFQQLALLESASEAIVSIPLGLLAFIWWIRRIRSGRPEAVAAPDADPN